MTTPEQPAAHTLFEVSWEVCNKVGGINTVIKSKAPLIQEAYSNYVLIGPLLEQSMEFDARVPPDEWHATISALAEKGITCRYGVWSIPGEPTVILVGAGSLVDRRPELKYKLWEEYKIDSLQSAWEFDEPLCFATAAGMLIDEYARRNQEQRIVAQCHEWLAGFCLLHLKSAGSKVGTVFTTHATILGRSITGAGHDLYAMLDRIDPTEWAYKQGVQDKHLTEVACAQHSDVFTTVSEITGLEAQKLLGKKPDVLLFNGFYTEHFPTFEETSIKHDFSREMLREFAAYYFFPYYTFDLAKTVFFFTSGRYELHNKGIDILIESLGALNRQLRQQNSDVHVVFFLFIMMEHKTVRADVLENKNFFHRVKSSVEWQSKPLLQKIVFDVIAGRSLGTNDMTSDFIQSLHADVRYLKRSGNPPMTPHDIGNQHNDPVLRMCREQGLTNSKDDRVKVVLYPGMIDASDGLLNVDYYDAIVGTHLGVFPSMYEPWGYTPLESAVLGVPAITTDLAGFGRYINTVGRDTKKGIFVLPRMMTSHDEFVSLLAKTLLWYATLDHAERVQNGFAAKSLSELCDWRHFVKNYFIAHNTALEKQQPQSS